jgi:predicted O-methyltransferase YrrM
MSALGIAYRYIQYRRKAKNRFKIHSPFAYGFLEKVLREEPDDQELKELDEIYESLKRSDRLIETLDFGAGAEGREYSEYRAKLGKIVQRRSHPLKRLRIFYNLSRYLKPETMLELGTAAGISTMYLKKPLPQSKMVTIEGCATLASVAEEAFQQVGIENVDVMVGNFDVVLKEALDKFETLDFVFFDGNHRKEPTLRYFNQCVEKINPNTVFVFDDIHWSNEMQQAWEAIKADKRVSVTMDIFWLGFVFFRKGIAKQDFVVKY